MAFLHKENENIDVVFVCPSNLYGRSFDYDLSVAYIQAFLKKEGIYTIQVVDNENIGLSFLLKKILKYNPAIVSIMCSDRNYYLVKTIAEGIKNIFSNVLIIAFGHLVTFSDFLIMNDCPYIDICIRGEGEYSTYEIVQFQRKLIQIDKIRGITYRKKRRIIRNPDRQLIGFNENKGSELDVLPSPYLNGVLTGLEDAGVLTSRGCSFGCIYCLSSAVVRHTIRYHSVDRVISELKKIKKSIRNSKGYNGRTLVRILDRDFSSDSNRAKTICQILIKEKLNFNFWSELRADTVDEELLELMYKAGFREVNLGLESAVPKVLRNIKKVCCSSSLNDLTPEKFFLKRFNKTVKIAKKIGLIPSVNIMLGLPGETINDARETLKFVKRLDVVLYYHHRLALYPGTELCKNYKEFGLTRSKSKFYDIFPYTLRSLYNVDSIPYNINAVQFIPHCKELRYFTDILLGCSWQNVERRFEKSNESFPFIIFDNFSTVNMNTFKWIKDIMSINAYLLFITPYKIKNELLFQKVRRIASVGLPTKEYHFLTFIKPRRLVVYYRPSQRPKSKIEFSFQMIPLSEIGKLKNNKTNSQIIVTLHSKKDIQMFVRIINDYDEHNLESKDSLLRKLIDLNISFFDGCRWLSQDCIARCPYKVIIENKFIRLCTHSEIIGKIGNSVDEISISLRRKFEEEKLKRGCQKCLVRNTCSKCLYPYPFTVEEYCTLRRNNPQINIIMKLLGNLKDFELRRYLMRYSNENSMGSLETNENRF